jgi:two-component system KDP operon response regulator KdpE
MEPAPPASPQSDDSPTVLVFEDEAAIREVVAGLLQEKGFAVKQAPDGPSALAEVGRDGIDLVVTEVR